ncbi:unnamed protein product [Lathyrus oleraceus]
MFRTSTMMEEKPHRNRIGKTYRIKAPIAISVRIIAQQFCFILPLPLYFKCLGVPLFATYRLCWSRPQQLWAYF